MSTITFPSVYGPVESWRYGRSLGIDPIGQVSVCSFKCVYCQLGEIERHTIERKIYIPTAHILQDLQKFAPWNVDIITLSGSGEPTLALNLTEILASVKKLTRRPTLVLTNGSLLIDTAVRAALIFADKVSVKVDAIAPDKLRRINRPVAGVQLPNIWAGLEQFRDEYDGFLSLQTMILKRWDAEERGDYIKRLQAIEPDEVQLNTPTRPKPLKHELDARENNSPSDGFASAKSLRPYAVQALKCVSADVLDEFAIEIYRATGIPVRYASAES